MGEEGGERSHVLEAKNCCYLWWSGNNQVTNVVEVCHVSKPSLRIWWHVLYVRPNLASISKMVLGQIFVGFVSFHIFLCASCGSMTWTFIVIIWNSPMFAPKKSVRVCCFPVAFSLFLVYVSWVWNSTRCKLFVPSSQPFRKLQTVYNMYLLT